MPLIDRYIAHTLAISFAICMFGITALYVMLDLFDRLGDFTELAQATHVEVLPLIARYYLARIPLLYAQVAPAIMLMASMFTMTLMVRNNELVPLFASGISVFRVARMHIVAGLLTAASIMAVQEFILPPLAAEISQATIVRSGGKAQLRGRQMFDGAGRVFYFEQILPNQNKMWLVRMVQRHPVTGRRALEVSAAAAEFSDDRPDGRMELILRDGEVRRFHRDRLSLLDGYPIAFKGDERMIIVTDLQRADMYKARKVDIEFGNTAGELMRKVAADPKRFSARLSLHLRLSMPLATLVLMALGLPLVIGTETKNFFLGVGLCILIAAAFYVSLVMAINLGNKAILRPVFAAWAPVALFGALAAAMASAVKT